MRYHLAQLNLATFRKPMEDPVNADFVNNLDRVNATAEAQPGFVWRLIGEGNDAMDVRLFENPNTIVNLSVWEDIESLFYFVYQNPAHRDIMRRRKEWFDKMDVHMVLWWVPVGHTPTPAEAKARLERLKEAGPTSEAFTFKRSYPAPMDSAESDTAR
ncbi:DUF3291 domain-containing protein [Saccharospirillum salsuginis]|uniref:DUF3291 domain-containing protein n=1 Tax=Saccharospirillum salsuginis TaxID=418750 RepID=A0A918K4Y7_9GAMM|nr:DUF3291 domain-containing protein [Saccharospirillum salsuginis]GGX49362.1 hypothetical protein GCM10007392_15830 [Saccharospirillum salsuginis]